MGEIAFLSCPSYAIVRASSIYGFGPGRMNFAKYIYEKLKAGEYIKALIDQYTSPTQASLLGKAIIEIAEKKLEGIFHIVGERMSRYEFAIKIAEVLGLNKSLIQKAEMKDMKWIAKRPRDSSLNSENTRKLLTTDFYHNPFEILKEEYLKGE